MAALFDLARRRTFALDGTSLTVLGRDPASDVCLDEPSVSRRHAEIVRSPEGRWRVVDLGSSQGVWVGGRRVAESLLADGDELRMGAARLRFIETPSPWADDDGLELVGGTPLSLASRVIEPAAQRFAPASAQADAAELRRDYDRLRAAYEINRAIADDPDVESLPDRLLDAAFGLLAADRGAILLFDAGGVGTPTLRRARWRSGSRARMVLSRTVIERALATRAGILSSDALIDDRFGHAGSIEMEGIRSTMCVPLIEGDEVLGVMVLDSLVAANVFNEKDLAIFTAVAGEAARAIRNGLLRRRIEEVTAEERRRVERVLRDLPSGILVVDSAGRISLLNGRAEELLPLLTSSRRGDALASLGALSIEEIIAGSAVSAIEIPIAGTPERVLSLRATRSVASDLRSEVVIVLDDVTSKREAEQRSARAERMAVVGQLAGGVAHDFNNLLCVVKMTCDVLGDELRGGPLAEDVTTIVDAVARATGLTKQLMAFSRRQVVATGDVDVDAAVDGMTQLLSRTLGANIELRVNTGAPGSAAVETGRFEQVLLNLVVNARDAMPDGGRITLSTYPLEVRQPTVRGQDEIAAGRYACVRLEDTGCGMTPEVMRRIFTPFFTTKAVGKGTGLGLATVYGIVQQSGGVVAVESTPGRGSSFEVCLPVANRSGALAADAAVRTSVIASDHTILVAEDEDGVRDRIVRMLTEAGFRVRSARDGIEALDLASSAPKIDLLVTDLMMPRLGGRELARRLRQRSPGLPVVFVTGYDLTPDEGEAPEPGTVLSKPFARADLLEHVARAVASIQAEVPLATRA